MKNCDECALLLEQLNNILDEETLDKRIQSVFSTREVSELALCINKLLDITEVAISRAIDTQNTYLDIKGNLLSDIRNSLSIIKGNCFMINLMINQKKYNNIQKYSEIVEKVVGDIEMVLK